MRRALSLIFFVAFGCSQSNYHDKPLFEEVAQASGVDFRNNVAYTEDLNPYTFRNFFNGAGVAIGDINNDGLQDIYFAGNQVDNKLYLNKGDFTFEDITETAGVACKGVWSTGVTLVDINGDGYLDIYVCKSGSPIAAGRHNELFINNHDLTFTERAKEYRLDIIGLSVQAAFFDYDKDGDLDCYVLTNSFKTIGNFELIKDQRSIPDKHNAGNKFLVNENGTFRDYSEEANIYRSNIGFGLGVTLGDFNNDSWIDIFVSNDFFERDYLYINDQKGSFKEDLPNYFESISMGSMGADFADLDNDGFPELFVTEMLPDSLSRRKTKTVFEGWNKYQLNVENGYGHQYSRNVMQKRIGTNTYSEVGRLAGVAATEWSWGALLFDMDNDGMRDIFVANGIYKDLLDRDYLTYHGAEESVRKILKEEEQAILKLIDLMPSSDFSNYAFKNVGGLRFTSNATDWGLAQPAYSSGSAYGDLDNDGDLDLVVNNINSPSAIYRNNTDSSVYSSITIVPYARSGNTFAVGTEVVAYAGTSIRSANNFVTRGFQSSVQPKIHLGLGKGITKLDSVLIRWPEGVVTKHYNIKTNSEWRVSQEGNAPAMSTSEKNVPRSLNLRRVGYDVFRHTGNGLNDFNRDRLLPAMVSNEMPSLLKGDINDDGQEEVYIGGGKDQAAGFLYFDRGQVTFTSPLLFTKYALGEKTEGELFDADQDGDLDLYLATGGRFFPTVSSAQEDKLLLNDGKGGWIESPHSLPFTKNLSASVVESFDFDNDGDLDLLVTERFDPFYYGHKTSGYVLSNEGNGRFHDVTAQVAPELINFGMFTDAVVVDFSGDGWKDIVLVGDWMPILALENNNGKLTSTNLFKSSPTEGWWHAIESDDLNLDGKPDFVMGNQGLNSFFKEGDRMYVGDFDANGSFEQVFCTRVGDSYFPIADRDELLSQLPSLKKNLLYYKDYAKKSVDELFTASGLRTSNIYQVNTLSSKMFVSSAAGYIAVDLPIEAQYAPIYGLLLKDVNFDGVTDLIAGGNQFQVKPQFGRYDASQGWFFKGTIENGNFKFEKGQCLDIKGQIRDIEYVEMNGTKLILFAKYDDQLEIFEILP